MIQKLVDDYLRQEQKEKSSRIRSGKFSPSSFGRCYRFQIWNRQDKTKSDPIDARTLKIFKAGHFFHDFLQSLITKTYPHAKVEVMIETPDVLGFVDVVLPNSVIEIKSQHSRSFWYMEKSKEPIEKQKYENILQGMAYCKVLKKQWLILIFVSKDDLTLAEYKFEYNERWMQEVENELTVLRGFWETGELPPAKPRAYRGKECQYCGYRTVCKETEKTKETENGRSIE